MPNPERPEFLDPRELPFVEPRSRGELPHLFKEGCSYFITFRLYDAICGKGSVIEGPQGGRNELVRADAESAARIAASSEPSLRLGSCVLAEREIATIVESALLHFNGVRYALSAWCIMPNHVHLVVTPFSGHDLSSLLHSWKSFTAKRIQQLLGRAGTLWERESFTHMIRNVDAFESLIRYTEENPVSAGLCESAEEWPFSSAKRRQPQPERGRPA